MPWRIVAFAAVAAVFVGLGIFLERFFVLTGSTPPVGETTDGDFNERFLALERKVQRLRVAEIRQPSVRQASMQAAEQSAADEHAPADEASNRAESEPVNAAGAEGLEKAAHREYLDGLSDKLDTEPYDQGWRVETERALSSLMPERFGPGITVDQVSCASTLCRARLEHRGSARLPEDKLMNFLTNRGSLSTMEVHADTDEDGMTTLYFLRAQEP